MRFDLGHVFVAIAAFCALLGIMPEPLGTRFSQVSQAAALVAIAVFLGDLVDRGARVFGRRTAKGRSEETT